MLVVTDIELPDIKLTRAHDTVSLTSYVTVVSRQNFCAEELLLLSWDLFRDKFLFALDHRLPQLHRSLSDLTTLLLCTTLETILQNARCKTRKCYLSALFSVSLFI